MRYPYATVFTAALIVGGGLASYVSGFTMTDIVLFDLFPTDVDTFRRAFIDHWYFGVALLLVMAHGFALWYGDGYERIDVS